jgi:hypothetical protein
VPDDSHAGARLDVLGGFVMPNDVGTATAVAAGAAVCATERPWVATALTVGLTIVAVLLVSFMAVAAGLI